MDLKRSFDKTNNQHTIEGMHFVLHCHHYHTLIHHAITSTPLFDGQDFFVAVAAADFIRTLETVCRAKGVTGGKVLETASYLYSELGFGQLDFSQVSAAGGRAVSAHSHLGQGYLNKWGKQSHTVDDFGAAFTLAAWCVAFGKKLSDASVVQTRCLAKGDPQGEFQISTGGR